MKKFLVMSFGIDAGGIEKSLIEFLKFLVSEGHHIDLYLWRPSGLLYDSIPTEVNIVDAKLYPGSISVKNLFWYLKFRLYTLFGFAVKSFRKFPISDYDIAISYCQNGYSPHYIIDKVKARKKMIFYHHGSYDRDGRNKSIDTSYYLKYDHFITVSNANRDMLVHHFPELDGKIEVINNLVDSKAIIEKSLAAPIVNIVKDCTVICTVGRIAPEKGQLMALEAAKVLKNTGFRFRWYFVGDGPDMQKCREYVSANGLDNLCIFVGAQTNPYPFMRACDLYVQPSHIEAESITLTEAIILKCNIIATDIDAVREKIGSKHGKICKCQPSSIADAIIGYRPDCDISDRIEFRQNETETKLRNLIS